MTKALKIRIGNLLFEFLAHTLVFLCTLNSARAVTACPLQALFNCLYCFFVGIKCYFHLLTPQFLRRPPLISSLDYTIYRNPKIVKRRCVTAPRSCRQFNITKVSTPEICFVLNIALCIRVPRSLFVKGRTVFAICFIRKHKTSRRGVHWTPVLMKLFVLCVCYDVMKIVYSNVAVNFRHLYNLIYHKICTVTCKCSSDHLLNCENSN